MASLTKKDEKPMAEGEPDDRSEDQERDDERDERDERAPAGGSVPSAKPLSYERSVGGGFFTIYKAGQGYWTRLGTAAAAAVIVLFSAYFIYEQLRVWPMFLQANGRPRPALVWGTVGGFLAGAGLLAWWLMNKPSNVDFLIATDSEMKKVNWTSRRELLGSTKVVIAFMFIIAGFLFMVDVLFGYFFYFIKVLKTPPF